MPAKREEGSMPFTIVLKLVYGDQAIRVINALERYVLES